MIEVTTFRLVPGADEGSFRPADRDLQTEFAYQQPGMLRRTTARHQDGSWIVIDVWRSAEDADACAARWGSDPIVARFVSFLDPDSVDNARYETLD
jgi:hypothetical protein